MRVVISQSMYFPWVGMLEQIRLADVFIHYDDVQFSKGSFSNRVQVKMPGGMAWMTAPLHNHQLGQTIDEVRLQPSPDWHHRHLAMLTQSFDGAPYAADALALAKTVIDGEHETVADLARESMLALCRYFGLDRATRFADSRVLGIEGSGSDRVLALVKAVGGSDYITGHGARNYLDHERFEAEAVSVSYMDYQRLPYPQVHGAFTPHVTALDLVANCGRDGLAAIASQTRNWKEFTDGPA
ncbi:WbqC-like protein [Hoeflea sp. IMCC20628]|uniref:WbqC family protein n=1 Tax=Hoeflea sp. IMCC20628 TaxID=1620421 RepID=UPI00063AA958|nr:WbqC family protein [Hoeflea sp. IMCC20628]AKI02045.1 WbqC-like protein [Hoeflea sp. IMCC20628]